MISMYITAYFFRQRPLENASFVQGEISVCGVAFLESTWLVVRFLLMVRVVRASWFTV